MQGRAGDGKLGHNQFDRVLLDTVLGEISDQKEPMADIFNALQPGGLLSVPEVVADPHFQRCASMTRTACSAGFTKKDFWGNRISFTINFEKR